MVQPAQGTGEIASHEALLPATHIKDNDAVSSQATQSPSLPTGTRAQDHPRRGSQDFLNTLSRKPSIAKENDKLQEPTLCARLDRAMTEAAETDNPEPIVRVLNDFDTEPVTGMGQQKLAVAIANEPTADKKVREALIQAKKIFCPTSFAGSYRSRSGPRSFLPEFDLVRHIQTYLKNCKEPENEDSVLLKEYAGRKEKNFPSSAAFAFGRGGIPLEKQGAIFNHFEPAWESVLSKTSYEKNRVLECLMPALASEEDEGGREKIDPKMLDRCLELCSKLAISIGDAYFDPRLMMKAIKQAYKGKETDEAYIARLSEISSSFFPHPGWEANTHVRHLLSGRPVIADIKWGDNYKASRVTYANLQEMMANLLSPLAFRNAGLALTQARFRKLGWTNENCEKTIKMEGYPVDWRYGDAESSAAQKMTPEIGDVSSTLLSSIVLQQISSDPNDI